MLCRNKKIMVNGPIQDFDAVSLYPSAMEAMQGILLGKPKVIEHFDPNSYDGYFIEIEILELDDIYGFPLIFKRDPKTKSKMFVNEPIPSFYLDKTSMLDLIHFYPKFRYRFIRGYYFDEGFNTKISTFIRDLFELRRAYKLQKNPLETTIKLLLNSIYGKSILKAMPYSIITVSKKKLPRYITQHYNEIIEINTNENIRNVYVKRKEPIDEHFALPQFGACVLSQSKHLMNNVMCLAEQNGIPLFYQDTDSIHMLEADIPKLSDLYKAKHGKELIGTNLGQYHSDFAPLNGMISWSLRFIGLGKKAYLDVLTNANGDIGYHIRMKGIATETILRKCEALGISVEELYMRLYRGETVKFNLLEGTPGFKRTKCFQQTTLSAFDRRVRFE
jgi:hypothetical protein